MSETESREAYINRLLRMGFDRKQAETIADGRETDALPEREWLEFVHAWENDKIEPMKPLVEKYGWDELMYRASESFAE